MSATSVGARRFLVFVFMSLVAQSSLAQFQGKIFTTPEERAYLDALREDFLNGNGGTTHANGGTTRANGETSNNHAEGVG